MSGRSRDRRVYLGSHPILFALLAAARRRPVLRLGGTLLVNDAAAYAAALTRIPLDRTAEGTTGGAAGRLTGGDLLFDQHGDDHRRARRSTADLLGAAGVARLRPVWTEVLDRGLKPLADGETVDLVPVVTELAGTTAAALLGLATPGPSTPGPSIPDPSMPDAAGRGPSAPGPAHCPAAPGLAPCPAAHCPASHGATAHGAAGGGVAAHGAAVDRLVVDGLVLAAAAREAAAAATRAHLPGPGRRRAGHRARAAADRLSALVAPGGGPDAGLAVMLAVAAINTTVAALPRAAAWAADDDLWGYAESPALATELLRVTAPAPLLPRVAAAPGRLPTSTGGCPARTGDQQPVLGGYPTGTGDQRPPAPGGCGVRAGDRLLLIARHAAGAYRLDPDPAAPAPAHIAQLVFGAGPHACPGAGLARAQLSDLLRALAPLRPVVVRARVDRRAALPGWRSLTVRATCG